MHERWNMPAPKVVEKLNAGDFTQCNLSEKIIERLKSRGIEELFPVQYKTLDLIRAGKDVVVLARTGTGKTLAFSIPIAERFINQSNALRRLGRHPTVIILAPTRELVVQITADVQSICATDCAVLAVYGGVPIGPQCHSLSKGVDVIIGTPGRIIDLIERNALHLESVKQVVLDEVDRMLDMGFSKDVESIISQLYSTERETDKPQTLLFSATMPSWVSSVARQYLSDDTEHISFVDEQQNKTALNVTHLALPCSYQERASTLADIIRAYCKRKKSRCIIFCERKKDADELAAHAAMSADCHVFHGDIPQDKRELVLEKFREGKYRTLITTNVAARGLDVPDVDLVIQCHPPRDVEDYIHRSGRTGRAERCGTSIVFYTPRERALLTMIERKAGITFRRISAPTLQDIIDSWASELVQAFAAVPEQTWSAFKPTALTLVRSIANENPESATEESVASPSAKEKSKKRKKSLITPDSDEPYDANGLLRVLCCALARLSGKDEAMESRSLLNAQKGLTTFKLELTTVANFKGRAFSVLREQLPDNLLNSVKNMTFIRGKKGFVFDVPSNMSEAVTASWRNDQSVANLELLNELPELEMEESHFAGPMRSSNWNNNGRGSWSNRGGSKRPNNSLSFGASSNGFHAKRGSSGPSRFGSAKRGRFNGHRGGGSTWRSGEA